METKLGSMKTVLEKAAKAAGFKFRNKQGAVAAGCCIKCGRDVGDRNKTELDRKEWLISGIDGICYDAMFADDEK